MKTVCSRLKCLFSQFRGPENSLLPLPAEGGVNFLITVHAVQRDGFRLGGWYRFESDRYEKTLLVI